jgi:hypothetical protein
MPNFDLPGSAGEHQVNGYDSVIGTHTLRSVTSTRTRPSPTLTATVTVPPRSPDRLCRTLLPNSSLASRRRHPRTGDRDRAPGLRTRGRPAPAPPARPPSRSPGSPAQPSAHPPSPAASAPEKSPGPPGRMYANAHSTQRLTSSRNPRPARPVRGRPWKADGAHRPSQGPDAVRYMSVDTATRRSTAQQGDTWRDREETARIAENSQLAGRFRRWWQVLGSNQRRLSRRFYSPLPQACIYAFRRFGAPPRPLTCASIPRCGREPRLAAERRVVGAVLRVTGQDR